MKRLDGGTATQRRGCSPAHDSNATERFYAAERDERRWEERKKEKLETVDEAAIIWDWGETEQRWCVYLRRKGDAWTQTWIAALKRCLGEKARPFERDFVCILANIKQSLPCRGYARRRCPEWVYLWLCKAMPWLQAIEETIKQFLGNPIWKFILILYIVCTNINIHVCKISQYPPPHTHTQREGKRERPSHSYTHVHTQREKDTFRSALMSHLWRG